VVVVLHVMTSGEQYGNGIVLGLELEYNEKGKEKFDLAGLVNKYDSPVKATNQVLARFSEIFLTKIAMPPDNLKAAVLTLPSQWYLNCFCANLGCE